MISASLRSSSRTAGIWRSCASGDGREPLGRLGLFLDPQRVVEFVEETAERDAQREFDNLRLAEIFPEPSEQRVGNAMRMFPGGDRILDRKLVPLVEFWVVAAVIKDMVGPGGRNTLYHQKRCNNGDLNLTILGPGSNPLEPRFTPVETREIDPFRTTMPLALFPAIAVATLSLLVVPPRIGPLIKKPARSIVTKSAVIGKQVPPRGREGKIVDEFIRARLTNRLAFLNLDRSSILSCLRGREDYCPEGKSNRKKSSWSSHAILSLICALSFNRGGSNETNGRTV
jgi:hypothetical protein